MNQPRNFFNILNHINKLNHIPGLRALTAPFITPPPKFLFLTVLTATLGLIFCTIYVPIATANSTVTPPAALAGIKVIVRSGKVKFHWRVPNDLTIVGYQYKQWTGNTEPADADGWKDFLGTKKTGTERRSIKGLTDGTEYKFRIRVETTGNVTGTPSDVITVIPGPIPAAPTARPVVTAVAEPGSRQITLSWGHPNNGAITKYQIRRRGVPIAHVGNKPDWNAWSDIPGSDKDTIRHVVTGLPAGVKYYFRIRAVAGTYVHGPVSYGSASSVIGVKLVAAPAAPPPKPTGLAKVIGNGQVTLTWDKPNNPAITGYQYKYWTGTPESGRWSDVSGSDKDTTSHVVTGLTNGTKYHFRIRAMAGRVAGVKSSSTSATPATPPVQLAPTAISAQAGYKQVELIWRNPNLADQKDTTITKYQIKYWSGNSETGDWSDISATINTRHAYYIVTGLTNSTTYSFRIRGLTNGFVVTESNLVRATPLASPPRTPARPQVVAGDGEVTLTWDHPNNPDITKYQIRQWTGGGERGSWSGWNDIPGSDKDTTSYTVTGLTNGVKYSFRIRAVAGIITGSQSPYTAVVIPKAVPGGITVAVRDSVGDSIAISVGIIHTGTRTVDSVVPTTEDGGSYSFTVVLDTQPSADVTIAVSSSDTTEGMVDKSSLVFTTVNWNIPQRVTVTGQADTLTDGDQDYTIMLAAAVSTDTNYNGIDPIDIAITNTDTVTATRRETRAVTMGGFTIIGADPGSLGVEGDKINARVIGTGIRLALPSDHRVPRATSPSGRVSSYPAPQAGVSFGAAAAYVDVDIDTPLPSGHGVTTIKFSKAAPTVTEPAGVNFGVEPSYVDIELDVELSSSSRAIVCLEEPEELSGNLSVYHLADVEGAVWTKLPSASAPSGYVCGETSSFSKVVVGSESIFGSESIVDYVWTVGVDVGRVVLPEATGGDGVITYSLSPPLPLDLEFNKDSRRAITGTPTKALAKTKFTYEATDEDGDTSELSFSITVRAAEEKERARVLSVVLASFGRATATGAVDVIGERFVSSSFLAGSPKLTLGGVSMTSFDTRSVAGAVDGVMGLSGGSDIELLEGLDREPVELRRISGRDLFAQSEFSIPLGSGGGDMGDGVMRGWTLWGSGAGSGFSGSNLDGDIDTEGELYTGYMGLDYRFGNRGLAGVAISRSVGEVDYEVDGSFHLMSGETGSIRGEVDLELTSVLPYAHYSIRPGLSMWGLFGAGIGDIELEDGAGEVEADVNMLMVALGVRQELARWGDIDFGLKSDGFAVQLKTEGVEGLSGVSGVARRLRLGLEMSRDVYVTGDSLLLPSVEIGGRWDGGDADSGVGMEVGGGVEYVDRGLGLSVEVRGRYLLLHEESEFEDWGGSFSLRMGDGVRGRGLWMVFEPEWGEVASGVERMWRGEVDSGVGGVGERGLSPGRVKFDVGYGMETRGSGWLVTPYSGVSTMGEGEREYRLGGKVGVGEWMDIRLEGERREVSSGVVDHGVLLWWKLLL